MAKTRIQLQVEQKTQSSLFLAEGLGRFGRKHKNTFYLHNPFFNCQRKSAASRRKDTFLNIFERLNQPTSDEDVESKKVHRKHVPGI